MLSFQVEELRKNLDFSRWTSQNKKVVHSSDFGPDEFDDQILTRYKEPVSVDDIVTSDSLKELNCHNYVHKMHKLIELEEITRHRIVARLVTLDLCFSLLCLCFKMRKAKFYHKCKLV